MHLPTDKTAYQLFVNVTAAFPLQRAERSACRFREGPPLAATVPFPDELLGVLPFTNLISCRDRIFGSTDCSGEWLVAMDTLKPPSLIGDTLRHFDELLDEARMLTDRINAALRREREPFFPERRHHYESHNPERRRT